MRSKSVNRIRDSGPASAIGHKAPDDTRLAHESGTAEANHTRVEVLAATRAAHLPYAAATVLLKEVLPLQDAISTSSAKSRMRTAGRALDARIERGALDRNAQLHEERVILTNQRPVDRAAE
jgi:hypothetical protein